ncbi:MAG TPA: class I SAM-dependent methyltransferase [Bryobacteraceae bacterium]
MNRVHRYICRSGFWKRKVEAEILPWALAGVDLGTTLLEVGPGPGVTTDLLRTRVPQLSCVEIDRKLAASLADRMQGSNVQVFCDDATALPFAAASFDTAVCFTMLHHVPSPALQDRLLAEVARVLRPGGIFAGTDSLYSRFFHLLHLFDTMVVVDPASFAKRLKNAGFARAQVEIKGDMFRFEAQRAS